MTDFVQIAKFSLMSSNNLGAFCEMELEIKGVNKGNSYPIIFMVFLKECTLGKNLFLGQRELPIDLKVLSKTVSTKSKTVSTGNETFLLKKE